MKLKFPIILALSMALAALAPPALAQQNYFNMTPTDQLNPPAMEESKTLAAGKPDDGSSQNFKTVTSVENCIKDFSEGEKKEILASLRPYQECLKRSEMRRRNLSAGEIQERIEDGETEKEPDHYFQVSPLVKDWTGLGSPKAAKKEKKAKRKPAPRTGYND